MSGLFVDPPKITAPGSKWSYKKAANRTSSLGHSYDAKIQPQDPSHEPVAGLETVMGGASTLEIFQEAVRDARQKTEQSLVESGKVGEGVNLNLTIDLSRRSLGELPNGIVDIVKHDVERYCTTYILGCVLEAMRCGMLCSRREVPMI